MKFTVNISQYSRQEVQLCAAKAKDLTERSVTEMEKKEDRRTAYSKMVIRESLFELMQDKPLNKISVKEICDKADVNRCTFYSYYTDIFDLYDKIIQEYSEKQTEVILMAQEVIRENVSDVTSIKLSDFYRISSKYFSVIRDNKKLCKFIFSQNTDNTIHTLFGKHFFDELINLLAPRMPEGYVEKFKNTYNFVSGGTTALIMSWLQTDCAEPIESISKQLAYYYYDIYNGHKLKQLR